MLTTIITDHTATISDLKKNPMSIMKESDGEAVAILNHNKPAFYCVPPDIYEQLMEKVEDMELGEIVKSRKGGEVVEVDIDEL
jgi:antitoxin StbD